MVVVSGNWVKNVATFPQCNVNSGNDVISDEIMAAKAILTCRPNSHHFQERTVTLDQPVKVGRSVARAKPTATNAIFDCKVLSRHHALLWYENGKFYLQDTKSSNGTFVNNSRLSSENGNHELSSGDIVQFGVDVVENNRKVTHGCIIATIKLYLPDGKEAKASPVSGGIHGMVPLDDLYRLNEIIQEANQREQCLESKLSALQHVVDETRKSAEESWQAYVGEERLLSRVSALETQLQQANKNFGEDRLREELSRLQEENESYQVAAKEALEKLHGERLEAVALAMEQERARITAEQEAIIAKEQYNSARLDLEELAKKFSEQQIENNEERLKFEQTVQDLESKLESESGKLLDLQLKIHSMNAFPLPAFQNIGSLVQDSQLDLIYNDDDVKCKEEIINENEESESLKNQSNGLDAPHHINLSALKADEKQESESEKVLLEIKNENIDDEKESKEDIKKVTFKLETEETVINQDECDESNNKEDLESNSKTLKYQFHAAQSELKRKIESLELISNAQRTKIEEVDKALEIEKNISKNYLEENDLLKNELVLLKQKWKECCNENQQQKDKLQNLQEKLEILENCQNTNRKKLIEEAEPNLVKNTVSYEQLAQLEEELIVIKERFAQISEDKLTLKRDLSTLKYQYDSLCNRFYNKFFWYVMPLIAMVIYLLISAMVS